jgi:acetyl esterase
VKPPLHAQSEALLAIVQRPGNPPMHTLDTAEARVASRKLHFAFRPPMPAGVATREVKIARAAAEGGDLAARLYRPASVAARAPLPALVWFHGGGWVIRDLDTDDVLCSELCLAANAAVLSVAYRRGPEDRFPAAVGDAVFAARWLRANALSLAIDPARLAVGGDSAGGNLAIVTALTLRDAGEPPLRFQLLVYPSTDQSAVKGSRETFGEGLLFDRDTMRWFGKRYLRRKEDALDWRASPLLAKSLVGLPPALIIAAELDPIVDDGKAFAERLRASAVPVEYTSYPGVIHGFFLLGGAFDAAREAVQQAGKALARALG